MLSRILSRNERQAVDPNKPYEDCQSCRLVGSGGMLLLGSGVFYHAYQMRPHKFETGYPVVRITQRNADRRRNGLALVGLGIMYLSVARFFYLPPFRGLLKDSATKTSTIRQRSATKVQNLKELQQQQEGPDAQVEFVDGADKYSQNSASDSAMRFGS